MAARDNRSKKEGKSWRQTSTSRPAADTRWFRRISLSTIAVALVAVLIFLVLSQYTPQKARLAYLGATEYGVLAAPPLSFIEEDLQALASMQPVRLQNLQDSFNLPQVGPALTGLALRPQDMLIFYVRMHGVSDAGEAYLIGSDFDPARPTERRFKLAGFLKAVQAQPVKTKLIVLDWGSLQFAPQQGLVLNEFPLALEKQLTELLPADPNLWVLVSHGMFEISHVNTAARKSIFGHYVAAGLDGAGDLNDDGVVSVGELAGFVRRHVSTYVDKYSNRLTTQSPRLIWGGRGTPPDPDTLTLVAGSRSNVKPAATVAPPATPAATAKATAAVRRRSGALPIGLAMVGGRPQFDLTLAPAQQGERVAAQRPGEGDRGTRDFLLDPSTRLDLAVDPHADLLIAQAAPADHASTADPASPAATTASSTTATAAPSATAAASAAPSPAATAAPTSDPAATEPIPAADQYEALLAYGWRLRDRVLQRKTAWSPIDDAPHLWREYQDLLLGYERWYRSGEAFDDDKVFLQLRDNLEQAQRVVESAIPPAPQAARSATLGSRLAQARPRPLAVDGGLMPRSLGMARSAAQTAGGQTGPEWEQLRRDFEQALADKQPGLFLKFTAPGGPASRFAALPELDFALQLAPFTTQANWEIVQRAVAARLTAETLAAETLGQAYSEQASSGSTKPRDRLVAADELRRSAETMLIEGRGQETGSITRLFDEVEQLHADIDAELTLYARITRQVREAWFILPDYMRLFAEHPQPDLDPARLMRSIETCQSLLRPGDASRTSDELRAAADELASVRQELSTALRAKIKRVASPPAMAGAAWQIEVLLKTALPTAGERKALVVALGNVAVPLDILPPRETGPEKWRPTPMEIGPEAWSHLRQRVDQQWRLAQLGGSDLMQAAGKNLEQGWLAVESAGVAAAVETRIASYRALERGLRDFYGGLAVSIHAVADEALALAQSTVEDRRTRRAIGFDLDRELRLLDPGHTLALEQLLGAPKINPLVIARGDAWYDLFLWQQFRATHGRDHDRAWDTDRLHTLAGEYHDAARSLDDEPEPPPIGELKRPEFEIASEPGAWGSNLQSEVSISVLGRANVPAKLWFILTADPELLEVQQLEGLRTEIAPNIAEGLAILARQEPLPLAAGATSRLQFRLVARDKTYRPSQLVLYVYGDSQQQLARHAIPLTLPAPEPYAVAVNSGDPDGTWDPRRLALLPFPNQETEYQLRLTNLRPQAVEVQVDLFALPTRPIDGRAVWPFDAEGDVKPNYPSPVLLATVPKLTMAADANSVKLPWTAAGAAAPLPMAPGSPAPTAPASPTGEAGPKAPVGQAIGQGLVMIVTDLKTGDKWLHRIGVRAQAPANYLKAVAKYNREVERIEIRVETKAGALLPLEGSTIDMEVESPLPKNANMDAQGEIKPGQSFTELFVDVPVDPNRVVDIHLNCDGYPRAFYFRVRCGDSQTFEPTVPPRRVRIVQPLRADRPAYNPLKTPSVATILQVDAPPGTFEDEELPGELIPSPDDANRNRVEVKLTESPRGRDVADSRLRFNAPRQVDARLIAVLPDGRLKLSTAVSDFTPSISFGGLRNTTVEIVAELKVQGVTSTGSLRDVVELILDSVAPEIVRIEAPRAVYKDQIVKVAVEARDDRGEISFVEAAWDLENQGKFPTSAPPAKAIFDARLNRWVLELATDGFKENRTYKALVRSIDRVGLISELEPVSVFIAPPPPKPADTPQGTTNTIVGTVTAGGDPVNRIEVVIDGVGVTRTDRSGNFTFKDVPAGTYKVKAEGSVRNKISRGESTVVVKPPPAGPATVTVEVR